MGRTSSSYVITSFYDQAPLDEYGEYRTLIVFLPRHPHNRKIKVNKSVYIIIEKLTPIGLNNWT